MRNVLITFGTVLCLAAGLSAQDNQTGVIGKGFKAGIGLSNITGDIDNQDAKVGFGGGGFVTFAATKSVAVQPEALFVMKGSKEDFEGETFKVKLSYIEVPILVKFMIPTQGNVKPNLFAGPAIAFLMSAKAEDEDIKDFLKSTDFSLVFGGGVDLPAGANVITIDIRYTLGLSNINDDTDSDDVSIKNTNISALVGLSL